MTLIQLSFVIIEYHCIDEIINCIQSIEKSCTNIFYEIIISSNSCYSINEQEIIAKSFPNTKWSFNPQNGGFAYAMNQGLKIAKGKYLIITNPDVKILGNIQQMISFMDNNTQIGAIAPQILNSTGKIQDSCRPYVNILRLVCRTIKRLTTRQYSGLSNINYSKVQTVDWIIGAFIMVRKNVYLATKGLDDGYFMYAEDLDWCTRIRLSGYEVVYYPKMQIIYEGSRSARKSFKYGLIFIKSHIRYWNKFGYIFGYPKRKKITFNN